MTKNKSKSIIFLVAALLLGVMSKAQSIAPQSLNSSGASMTQPNGSLSFTVGELVVIPQTDNQGNKLGGGFTAGAALTTSSIKATNPAVLDVKVYPNPTTALLNIQINDAALEQFMVSITDVHGKEVYAGKYAGLSNIIGINMAAYAEVSYVLNFKNPRN